ncbi:hypothetical protein [Rhodoferax sp.]|uniref:hypothetical protein n=1 Tax=Rhodoferax sp. TaxID=50421 RepID=UPI002746563D|nr:hypothetical protein [Rhodoferax sp.]
MVDQAPETGTPPDCLTAAGFAPADAAHWRHATPALHGEFQADAAVSSHFFALSQSLLERLPAKAKRDPREAAAALALLRGARAAREGFLARHVDALYDRLTTQRSRFVRVQDLPDAAAWPMPTGRPTR